MPSATPRRWLALLGGTAISAVALWLVLRRLSLDALGAVLAGVTWWWLVPMAALRLLSMALRSARWHRTLVAMHPGPCAAVFRAVGLGAAANLVLPFKLGALLRIGLLKRHNPDIRPGDALVSIGAERALDGVVLGLAALAALPFAAAPGWMLRAAALLLAVMLAVTAAGMLGPVHRRVSARLPARGALGLGRRLLLAFHRGTQVLRRPADLAAVAGWTALAWLCEASILWCAVRAVGRSLAAPDALVVTLLYAVGLLIPSAPGHIGTHQALAVALLAPFGIAAAAAVSTSIVLQATTVTLLGVLGAGILLRESRVRALVAEGRAAVETAAGRAPR